MILDRMRVFNLRELQRHPARAAMSLAVVAISATLLVAVFGIAGSITGSSDRLVAGIGGNASLEVSGVTDTGFPEAVRARRREGARCRRGRADAADIRRNAVRARRAARRGREHQGHAERSAARGPRRDRPVASTQPGTVAVGSRQRVTRWATRSPSATGRSRSRPSSPVPTPTGSTAATSSWARCRLIQRLTGSRRHDRFGIRDHRAERRPRPGPRRQSRTRWTDEPSSPIRRFGPRNPVEPSRSCAP